MRCVLSVVKSASVDIDNKTVASICNGFLIYVGITQTDTQQIADKLAAKISKLRIFADENGKLNKAITDMNEYEILCISNFTLYGNPWSGNRPDFMKAAKSDISQPLYDYFIKKLSESVRVKSGVFGADMLVKSINNGPINMVVEL